MAIDREKVLLAAQGFIQKKRYDRAVAEYQKIIQQDPDDARTLLKIGDLQSKMEAHAEAIATYERVGKYYAAQGFALKAIAVYKQIREIIQKHVPEIADRYGHITPQLAELYAQLGLVSDALAAYDEVATQMQRSGQEARAVEVFRKIVDLDTTNPLPHLRLAEAYSRVKNIDEAIGHFGTAAEILTKLDRREDALKVLERLLHHRAEPIWARRAAEIYLSRGKAQDGMLALAKLQISFQADPRSLETLALLARAFVLIGQPSKSLEVQKEIGRIAKEQGNYRIWRETVDNLMRVAPNDADVQRLATSPPPRAASSMPVVEAAPVSLNEAEIEELSADDIEIDRVESVRPALSSRQPAALSARLPAFSAPDVEVSEAEGDPAEFYGEDPEADPENHPRRIFADAESFQRLGLTNKAIERLQQGIEANPDSVSLRRKLRDIYYEAGEYARTAEEMIAIGSLLLAGDDAQGAAEELGAILGFAPEHPQARQMLVDLGYELPATEAPTSEYASLDAVEESFAEARDPFPTTPGMEMGRPEFDSQPLPSYDLEDVDPAEAMSSPGYDVRAETYEKQKEDLLSAGALPSFPMEEDEPERVSRRPLTVDRPPSMGPGGSEHIEDALEEAEFFLSRGLLEDARAILEESLKRSPNNALLIERLRELDLSVAQATGSSGTRERPLSQQPEGESEGPVDDRAFDIAASLDALDALDREVGHPSFGQPVEQVDVEEVFAKFKAGVRAQVSETDSATHYDLGLAYREMDLMQDAIDEFALAARDVKRECVCQHMIGSIYRAQGNVNGAIDAFIKGLHAEHKTSEQEVSLYYELGDAYESKGNAAEALYYFRKVAHRAPNHDDPRGAVSVRIRTVQQLGHRPSMERAVNASDEFDAAFDAALGGGKP